MSYKEKSSFHSASVGGGSGFESQLRSALDAKIRDGAAGMDLNDYKRPKQEPNVVYRNYEMGDEVISLGCKIHGKNPELRPKVWLAWMTDAIVKNYADEVYVYLRSPFFCWGCEKYLDGFLRAYFDKPIRYKPDSSIQERVVC